MENHKQNNDISSLKDYLDTVLRLSEKKFSYDRRPDAFLIRWGGLIVNAVKAYGDLIKNEELEDLRKDVDELKQLVNNKVTIR